MALQKLVPTGGLAAQRSGIQSAAVADVVDGRIAQLESEIVQGTHDALAAPGWIFLEQFDHEFLQRRIDGWSTDGVGPGKGPLLGDQDTEPPEQGIGSDKGGPLPQAAPADELGFARQPNALGVGEAVGFATELFQENPVFFLEVFNDSLLVSAHPAGAGDQEELKLRRHKVENPSKIPATQSSRWSRLSFLAVQDERFTAGQQELCALLAKTSPDSVDTNSLTVSRRDGDFSPYLTQPENERLVELLRDPEIASVVTREKMLAAIKQRQMDDSLPGFQYNAMMDLVNQRWPHDAAVIAFYSEALAIRGEVAISDLFSPLPGIWDDSLLEPVIHMMEKNASTAALVYKEDAPKQVSWVVIDNALAVLDRHYSVWATNASIPPRLSAV